MLFMEMVVTSYFCLASFVSLLILNYICIQKHKLDGLYEK